MTETYRLPLMQELESIANEHNTDLGELLKVYQQAYIEHKIMTGSLAHLLYENGKLYDEKMKERHQYQMRRVRDYVEGGNQE